MIIQYLLMKKKLKAILFDLDDTLFLEKDFVKSGFKAVASHIQNNNGKDEKIIFNNLWSIFNSGKRKNIFDLYVKKFGNNSYSINEMVDLYRAHIPNINLLPGINKYLLSLSKKYKLGLVTDGYIQTQNNKINVLGLKKRFDRILITEELGREFWKPSIVPFSKICDSLEVSPMEAVYIADNPLKDFKGPNQLGMHSIRLQLKDGEHYKSEPENKEFAPAAVVYNIENLKIEVNRYNA